MIKRKNYSIATRTRYMYFAVSAFTVLILVLIVAFIAGEIADDASQRIARQYSIEAAGNFQAHMNPHLTLLSQLSRSATVARWLADDTNESAKDYAFKEIIGYAIYTPTSRFMLTAYNTFNIYDFLPGSAETLTREEFISLGRLVPGEEAQWFFNTRDDLLPFNLNVQREMEIQGLDPHTLQMWANQRVYHNGGFVGVVAIGFPFEYIFGPTFGSFQEGEMRGYIIDNYGGVRVDSAGILHTFADGLPTFPVIPETLDNPHFAEHVYKHLQQRIDGIYHLGAYTMEAVRLTAGSYSYASIAPIIGTDWSVVVLSYQAGLFDFQYVPLVFVIVFVIILSLIVGNIGIRRIVISPLLNLTKSAAEVYSTGDASLYGMTRDDEIGDLARTIFLTRFEHQRAEIAEEKTKAKSEFLARMSHEIRTPISSVIGISEIGMRTFADPEVEEQFEKIYESGKLLLGIVNDILDFSKIESRKLSIVSEEYETSHLIRNVSNLHYAYLGDKNIKFNLKVDKNLPKTLKGDKLRVEQIIINLLSNAFKYTDDGRVDLSMKSEEADLDNSIILEIKIKDTGLGMTQGQVDSIFDEYARFHENEKSSVSGTGLGMAIVHNIARLMNAEIDIVSEINEGTTVTVGIPQEVADSTILGNETATELQLLKHVTKRESTKFTPDYMPYGKVLVVDDIESNLYVAQGLLAFYGLNTETCTSGQEAIDKIAAGNSYDIIFMDHMMPNIDGIEAMKTLREMNYTLPIVILTANALAGEEDMYTESGFDAFLSKPIITEKLDAILVKYIKAKQTPEVIEAAEKEGLTKINNAQSIEEFRSNVYVLGRLRSSFVKDQKNVYDEITSALKLGEFENAHLLTHTLKGIAAIIHEPALSQAAEAVEFSLKNNEAPQNESLSALEAELSSVIASINKTEGFTATSTDSKIITLLDKLPPLLEQRDNECINLLPELRTIPEAAILVKQIEKFRFKQAQESVEALKAVLDL